MNKKCTIGQFIGLLLGWATWLLCGCSDDFQTVPSSEGDKTDILVSLKILPPGMESPLTRSVLDPIGDEYELSTTEAEHRINTLTLIMMDVDNGKETFESSQTIIAPPKEGDTPYNVTFELKGISGTKRFYLGANMRDEHRKAFETDQRIFNADESSDGHNIVGSLMTVNHENDGEGSDILMTAAITTNKGSRDIVFDGTEGSEIKIDNPVKLVRTVAKVLLTCVTKEDDPDYVKVIDSNDYETKSEENTGWIKLDSVNYMLNVLNRKTYMDYREEGTGENAYLTDPNYAMSDFIELRDNGGYGLKDLTNYQANFLYYDTQQMVEMLQGTKGERCITRKATLFEESKVNKNDHYTEGLYCPENMVSNDMPEIPADTFASVNRFVTTHVMVGAKYTPKKIWVVNEEGTLEQKTADSEDKALEFLNKDLTDTEYLPGTFWQDNDKKYYSLSGMRKKLQDGSDTEFNRYDGGWGYYYTYIDGKANKEGTIDYANETRWGIKRNHYYILKVNQFVAPGSAFPGNEVMRIHSELIDWKDKGSSEVEIKVPQNSEKEVQQ